MQIREKHYTIILHGIVFIWGFTGILANLIQVQADFMVFLRMGIAVLSLYLFFLFTKTSVKAPPKEILLYLLTGGIIMLHWYFFFESIKVSKVSIAVVCLSTATVFTAFVEPLFFKRKIRWYEVFIALLIFLGIFMIFGFETEHALGIVYGLIAAFLAALFTVLNGVFIKKRRARIITFWEMLGGALLVFIYLLLSGKMSHFPVVSSMDWLWLFLLGVVCTSFAFLVSVEIMKTISPFTVSLSVNLEPIYTILLSLLIFGESELLHPGFYIGTAVILLAVLSNAFVKVRNKRKNRVISKVGLND